MDIHHTERLVPPEQMSVRGEADYIVRCAQARETHVVGYGALVLFSAANGEAWVLDPEDEFALCLARDGQRLPVTIMETDQQFGIDWPAKFRLEGRRCVVSERNGQLRTIEGYPVKEIRRTARPRPRDRTRRHSGGARPHPRNIPIGPGEDGSPRR